MLEFAGILPVAMIVLFYAIQLGVLGRDSLALGQMNYQAARWTTSLNPAAQCTDIVSYMSTIASPSIQAVINKYGISCDGSTPNGLGVTLTCPVNPSACTSGSTRPQGTEVQITVTMNTQNDLFLTNPFLGVPLPQSLNSTEIALTN
jgi:Flp pilus assembly protein TadG